MTLPGDEQIINDVGDLGYEVCSEFSDIGESDRQIARDLIRMYLPHVKTLMRQKGIAPSDIKDNEGLKEEVRELVAFVKLAYYCVKEIIMALQKFFASF